LGDEISSEKFKKKIQENDEKNAKNGDTYRAAETFEKLVPLLKKVLDLSEEDKN
jgi:hypothetical protein